jgi:DNA modification methylase
MGADDFGNSGGLAAGAHGYADDADTATRCMRAIFTDGFRVTKAQAHLYMFLDLDYYNWARAEATLAGWKVHRTPLIWHKPNGSRMPWAKPPLGPQRKYEVILYAVKGDKPVERIAGDVLSYSSDENLGHAAQKPVALFVDLLSRSARPGMRVLDPFCGTGPVIPAAAEMKCFSTAIELDPTSYAIAAARAKSLEESPL